MITRLLSLPLLLCASYVACGSSLPDSAAAPRPMSDEDAAHWRDIQGAQLTPNGAWLVYTLSPDEYSPQREAVVVVRSTRTEVEHRFPAGDPKLGAGNAALSEDGRWLAFVRVPGSSKAGHGGAEPSAEKAERPGGKQVVKTALVLVDVERGAPTVIENIRSFVFGGKSAEWIALQGYGAEGAAGSPLSLQRLDSSAQVPLGDVCEFSFDRAGTRLAWSTCTADGVTNALQLRHLTTGRNEVLDSKVAASYRGLSWSKDGQALATLRTLKKEPDTEAARRDLLSFVGIGRGAIEKTELIAGEWAGFPAGHEFDPTAALSWREEGRGLFFSVRALPKPREPAAPKVPEQLRLWHWRANLVPWQKVLAEPQEEPLTPQAVYSALSRGSLSYVSLDDRRYVPLGSEYFFVEPQARGRHVLGYDVGGQDGVVHEAIYGRSIRDYILVDLSTAQRTLIATQVESIYSAMTRARGDGSKCFAAIRGHRPSRSIWTNRSTSAPSTIRAGSPATCAAPAA